MKVSEALAMLASAIFASGFELGVFGIFSRLSIYSRQQVIR